MTPLFIINFNIHPEKGGFHAFPQCIQAQGAGGTAVEGVMHDEVEAIELGHIIAHDIAEYEAFEMTAHGISRQLFFHGFIILGFPCIDADIGCIAFIAAATMGDIF